MRLETAAVFLFVPADRPERFAKALASGADAVVIDLEDGVAPAERVGARASVERAADQIAGAACPVILRVNASGTEHHAPDLAVSRRAAFAGVMLAKAEDPDDARRLSDAVSLPVLALIESARGLALARAMASAGARLAFGSIDFAADLGCAHTREALLAARSELVLASRLAGLPAPVDGVTTDIRAAALVADDMRHAVDLGMGGKLLIHPAQIEPARLGLAPTAEEVRWAERVLAAGHDGATTVGGTMVDPPVRLRAKQVLRRRL